MKLSRTKWTIILILVVVAVVFIVKSQHTQTPQISTVYSKIKGDAKADFRVVDFFDFQCPSCASTAILISQYMEKYPGRIQVEAKYYPLTGHQHSMIAAKFADCARQQGKFWEMHDEIMVHQPEWREKDRVQDDFYHFASTVGLDKTALSSCIADPITEQIILKDKSEGQMYQVRSTPSFFVNGKFIAGRKSFVSAMRQFFGEPDESQEASSGE